MAIGVAAGLSYRTMKGNTMAWVSTISWNGVPVAVLSGDETSTRNRADQLKQRFEDAGLSVAVTRHVDLNPSNAFIDGFIAEVSKR